jgi:hypothetical protein
MSMPPLACGRGYTIVKRRIEPMKPSRLDSPYFTDITREVLARRDAIVEAVLARNGTIDNPTEAAFTTFVDNKVIPIASLYGRWAELREAGSAASLPEHLLGATLHVLGEMLYDNSVQAQNLIEKQPSLN